MSEANRTAEGCSAGAFPRIVCKFGGSSLAGAEQFHKVRAIIEADQRRRIIVPSAPGKRDTGDAKITDLLYLCHHAASVGTDFSAPFAQIVARFAASNASLVSLRVSSRASRRFARSWQVG